MRRRGLSLAMILAGPLALTACGPEAYVAVGSAPQLIVGNNVGGGMDALLSGRVRYLAEHDCIVLESGDSHAPVIWPEGSSATIDEVGLIIEVSNSGPIREGVEIEAGGGYLTPSPQTSLPRVPEECMGDGGEYAFVQRIMTAQL